MISSSLVYISLSKLQSLPIIHEFSSELIIILFPSKLTRHGQQTSETSSALNQAAVLAPPTKEKHNNRIASIPADDIGPKVVSAAIEVVKKLSETMKTFQIEFTHIPWGTAYYKEHGRYVNENALDILRSYNATLFGSVGAPSKLVPSDL
jgi:hypothetical protein